MTDDLFTTEPTPDFNNPIGLLKACHQRILGFCELLEKIVVHTNEHGVDKTVTQAAQKVHRYFSTAGEHHTADEEEDLFPLLLDALAETGTVIQSLQHEHSAIHALWIQLDSVLSSPALIDETSEFENWVKEFSDAYKEHIQVEETELFSKAEEILTRNQLEKLGNSMKKRREIHQTYSD